MDIWTDERMSRWAQGEILWKRKTYHKGNW